MPIRKRKPSIRKPSSVPRVSKVTQIRTKRQSDQSLSKIKKEIINQALYGRPIDEVLQAVVDGYATAKSFM